MFCKKCGNNVPDGAKFCDKCGTPTPVAGPAPQPVAPAPAPQPKPVAPAPQPAPQPRPVAPAPQPAPQPRPVAPAPQPAPQPRPVAPAPQPAPQPRPAAPQPKPAPAPKAQKEKGNAGKVIGIVIAVVLLVAALGVGGFFGYKFLNDPSKKLDKAITAGNATEVAELYKSMDAASKKKVENSIVKYVDGLYDSFLEGKSELKFDDLTEVVDTISSSFKGSEEGEEALAEVADGLETINASREAFDKAASLETDGKVAEAMAMYAKVSKDDTDNYKVAQEKIASLKDAYAASVVEDANALIAKSDYVGAYDVINAGLEVLPENAALLAAIDAVKAAEDNEAANAILETVYAAFKNNQYSTGYNTLSQAVANYPDNAILKELYDNFDETYLGYVKEKLDVLVASKSWDDALAAISAAASNVGSNNTTLAQMKEDVLFKYKEVSMIRLAGLKDAGNTDAIKELIREMKGYIPNDTDVKNLMAEYDIR